MREVILFQDARSDGGENNCNRYMVSHIVPMGVYTIPCLNYGGNLNTSLLFGLKIFDHSGTPGLVETFERSIPWSSAG